MHQPYSVRTYNVKDDIEHVALHSIPLWMFGFLY